MLKMTSNVGGCLFSWVNFQKIFYQIVCQFFKEKRGCVLCAGASCTRAFFFFFFFGDVFMRFSSLLTFSEENIWSTIPEKFLETQ